MEAKVLANDYERTVVRKREHTVKVWVGIVSNFKVLSGTPVLLVSKVHGIALKRRIISKTLI